MEPMATVLAIAAVFVILALAVLWGLDRAGLTRRLHEERQEVHRLQEMLIAETVAQRFKASRGNEPQKPPAPPARPKFGVVNLEGGRDEPEPLGPNALMP